MKKKTKQTIIQVRKTDDRDEVVEMITVEDLVEQAVYAANAPECCEEHHAENMMGMLGATVIDPDIFHEPEQCPMS